MRALPPVVSDRFMQNDGSKYEVTVVPTSLVETHANAADGNQSCSVAIISDFLGPNTERYRYHAARESADVQNTLTPSAPSSSGSCT